MFQGKTQGSQTVLTEQGVQWCEDVRWIRGVPEKNHPDHNMFVLCSFFKYAVVLPFEGVGL